MPSPFDIIFIAMFIAGILIRAPYDRANRSAVITESRFDSTEKAALLSAVSGAILFPLLYLATPLLNFANYNLPLWQGLAGTILAIPSLWLFWRAHKDLGRQFSPKLEIKESHELITHGVYKYVRHPMYTSVLGMALCQLFLIGNWIAGPAYLAGFGFLYITRVDREEQLMMQKFGENYTQYMASTNRLFPKILN